MCQTANQLRLELYKASRQYRPTVMTECVPDASTLAAIRANQAESGHVGALQQLREHYKMCEECRQSKESES